MRERLIDSLLQNTSRTLSGHDPLPVLWEYPPGAMVLRTVRRSRRHRRCKSKLAYFPCFSQDLMKNVIPLSPCHVERSYAASCDLVIHDWSTLQPCATSQAMKTGQDLPVYSHLLERLSVFTSCETVSRPPPLAPTALSLPVIDAGSRSRSLPVVEAVNQQHQPQEQEQCHNQQQQQQQQEQQEQHHHHPQQSKIRARAPYYMQFPCLFY